MTEDPPRVAGRGRTCARAACGDPSLSPPAMQHRFHAGPVCSGGVAGPQLGFAPSAAHSGGGAGAGLRRAGSARRAAWARARGTKPRPPHARPSAAAPLTPVLPHRGRCRHGRGRAPDGGRCRVRWQARAVRTGDLAALARAGAGQGLRCVGGWAAGPGKPSADPGKLGTPGAQAAAGRERCLGGKGRRRGRGRVPCHAPKQSHRRVPRSLEALATHSSTSPLPPFHLNNAAPPQPRTESRAGAAGLAGAAADGRGAAHRTQMRPGSHHGRGGQVRRRAAAPGLFPCRGILLLDVPGIPVPGRRQPRGRGPGPCTHLPSPGLTRLPTPSLARHRPRRTT